MSFYFIRKWFIRKEGTQLRIEIRKFSTEFVCCLVFMYLKFNLSVCICYRCYIGQFNFCYLLRFAIISRVYGAFSLSLNVHVLNVGTLKFVRKMSLESFDTGIVKKSRNLSTGPKRTVLFKKNMYLCPCCLFWVLRKRK